LPLLTASSVGKSYAGIAALKHASFELQTSEVHALVGENGAGKSTLIKIFTGAVQPDEGEIRLDGRQILHHTPQQARSLGIVAIYQQPALFPDLTVSENIALANEAGGPWRILDWRARRAKARELLDAAGARIHPDAYVSSLSMPEQQLVEIARALVAKARVLILDEPTASLTEAETRRLFGIIRELRARGTGLIYISHRLEELFEVADRVTVLRDGVVIGTHPMSKVDRPKMIQMMVGRELSAVFPKQQVPLGEIVLETKNLRARGAGVRDVSIAVRRGEILGLAGMVGSGRTQFAETLFGLTPADGGTIRIEGRPQRIDSPGARYLTRPGVCARGPATPRTDYGHADHGQSDAGEFAETFFAAARRTPDRRRVPETSASESAIASSPGSRTFRRQSTEGRAGAVACDQSAPSDSG
jgi:rhamnose transport system ATP-binding protein